MFDYRNTSDDYRHSVDTWRDVGYEVGARRSGRGSGRVGDGRVWARIAAGLFLIFVMALAFGIVRDPNRTATDRINSRGGADTAAVPAHFSNAGSIGTR
jgi:hypothetical protein